MQRLRNYAIASVIAPLVFSLTPSSGGKPLFLTCSSFSSQTQPTVLEAGVVTPQPGQSLCRGKSIPVSPLDTSAPQQRRTSLLHEGIAQRSRLVIRDRAEWSQLWVQLTSNGSNKPPLPEVDFSRELIVVAAMGQKPTGGYEILIDSACEVDNHVEVVVRSVDFVKCGSWPVLTAPVDIVRLPRTDLPVVFRETEVSSGCNAR